MREFVSRKLSEASDSHLLTYGKQPAIERHVFDTHKKGT